MNIADLLSAAAKNTHESTMTSDQQVNRLREITALRAEAHTFVPGQIMLHKYPSAAIIKGAEHPHLFIRYLEQPMKARDLAGFEDQGSAHLTAAYDCEAAFILGSGQYVTFFLDSAAFKPHPDFPVEA